MLIDTIVPEGKRLAVVAPDGRELAVFPPGAVRQQVRDGCTTQLRDEPVAPQVDGAALVAKATLAASDVPTVRVVEDLIDVLVAKGIIETTDLPAAAQEKLATRDTARSVIAG